MPIIDFTNVEKVYRGSVEMKKVYEGQTVVWEKSIDYFYVQNEYAGSNILTLTKTGSALTTASDLEYSLDETNWTSFDLTQATNTVTIPQGGKVYMRSTTGFSTDGSNYLAITTSEDCSAGGNVMSLIDYTNIGSVPLQAHCLRNLFYGNTKLIDASDLQLPRTTLVSNCYRLMFSGCSSLTQVPVLPATILALSCYYGMFQDCTSLTQAPTLPVTTLADYCYSHMFQGCTSLAQAPSLPATTLADYCYASMFLGCTSLTQAPTLPATTLDISCYEFMFRETPLTTAPALPATTLADNCYYGMFYGCTSLAQAPALLATTLATQCYRGMFWNCTSLTQAPSLPATTLTDHCYQQMFYGCTGLVTIPSNMLPAMTMANECYDAMFRGCTSLTSIPSDLLPATTLANNCYHNMFRQCTSLSQGLTTLPAMTMYEYCYASMFEDCTSLVTAPRLPATILQTRCYDAMFYQCSSLKSITCLATNISASGCTNWWVYGVSATGTFYKSPSMSSWTTGVSGIPSGWTVTSEEQSTPLYIELVNPTDTVPLQIMASGSTNKTLAYSYDNQTWTGYTATTNPYTIQLNSSNPRVYFKATSNVKWSSSGSIYWYFKKYATASDVPLKVGGNIFSLENTDFQNVVSPRGSYSFYMLFQDFTCLTDASDLFLGSSNTTMYDYCYYGMFWGCSSLTSVPIIPASTMRETYCCSSMFWNCSSLVSVPENLLPATTLAQSCYEQMFGGCSSLVNVPKLSCTTLAESCYNRMFLNCTSLRKSPDLPAPTLVKNCYSSMFNGCTSLKYITCLATNISASNCTFYWVNGVVIINGEFTKAASMSSWTTGRDGIPSGWTVINA